MDYIPETLASFAAPNTRGHDAGLDAALRCCGPLGFPHAVTAVMISKARQAVDAPGSAHHFPKVDPSLALGRRASDHRCLRGDRTRLPRRAHSRGRPREIHAF